MVIGRLHCGATAPHVAATRPTTTTTTTLIPRRLRARSRAGNQKSDEMASARFDRRWKRRRCASRRCWVVWTSRARCGNPPACRGRASTRQRPQCHSPRRHTSTAQRPRQSLCRQPTRCAPRPQCPTTAPRRQSETTPRRRRRQVARLVARCAVCRRRRPRPTMASRRRLTTLLRLALCARLGRRHLAANTVWRRHCKTHIIRFVILVFFSLRRQSSSCASLLALLERETAPAEPALRLPKCICDALTLTSRCSDLSRSMKPGDLSTSPKW
jgi:hypothetical protein